ncbi:MULTISPECIES: L-aspartate oxidase [Caproicibacterium]|uniref:L-aspartate oxidase n=1 Tax=Caproicibacterium argilliputei TaxID=3030016 RepID=A0AA97D852_9FIRM|nr:L-aspartate oxidase [Caproicibacterium argilliputei]WOC31422.1 L-aspartate oxidase [Caproicibacterium argilliputei]
MRNGKTEWDVLLVGTGVSGLFCALHLPASMRVLLITKAELDESDSFLAQGGICVLRNDADYAAYFADTLRAGHYENRRDSVELMIRSSQHVIRELACFGVDFARRNGELLFTREGAHSAPRILYHDDCTGKEITQKLLAEAQKRPNLKILTHTTLVDLLCTGNRCRGAVLQTANGTLLPLYAADVVLATGGVGGVYEHSTNFPHLTGDALALALKHGVRLENPDYVQIHPTTLYSDKPGRSFLISESVRGEGAVLLDKNGRRFTKELLPRDLLTQEIYRQMKKDKTRHVWLSMQTVHCPNPEKRFPTIWTRCLEEGINPRVDWIPVVPAQHYFMGGIQVNLSSRTTMEHLYAVGETACNGVHGANRLASNSLLESLVFAERAAADIRLHSHADALAEPVSVDWDAYRNLPQYFAEQIAAVQAEIARQKERRGHR